MPRPLRIEYAGAWYHVMNRGSEHRDVYCDKEFFQFFIQLLSEINQRFQVQTHAYCLMDNHYHLLLHTPIPNLSMAMKHIGAVYTQKFNRTNHRDGALFRGRFKSILVDSNAYLLELSRYIHLNPVSAGILNFPEEYPWSSYQYYINGNNKYDWLYLKETLNRFGEKNQVELYKKFVSEGIDPGFIKKIEGKKVAPIIGAPTFIEEFQEFESVKKFMSCAAQCPSINEIISFCAKYFCVEISDIINIKNQRSSGNLPRKIAIYLSATTTKFSNTNTNLNGVVNHFSGITLGSIRELCRRFEAELKKDESLLKIVKHIKEALLYVAV